MHYIIDGYNLLFYFPHQEEPLQKRRESLIQYVHSIQSKNRFTLVFDAKDPFALDAPSSAFQDNVEIRFSPKNQTADEYLVEMVLHAPNKNQITVVTSDKRLQQHIRHAHINVCSISMFLNTFAQKKKNRRQSKPQKEHPAHLQRLLKIFNKNLGNG